PRRDLLVVDLPHLGLPPLTERAVVGLNEARSAPADRVHEQRLEDEARARVEAGEQALHRARRAPELHLELLRRLGVGLDELAQRHLERRELREVLAEARRRRVGLTRGRVAEAESKERREILFDRG